MQTGLLSMKQDYREARGKIVRFQPEKVRKDDDGHKSEGCRES